MTTDLDNVSATSAKAAAELAELRRKVDALSSFAEFYARCPCCNQVVECEDGCTFANDVTPTDLETMQFAREALK
jgi:hypothetical protein